MTGVTAPPRCALCQAPGLWRYVDRGGGEWRFCQRHYRPIAARHRRDEQRARAARPDHDARKDD